MLFNILKKFLLRLAKVDKIKLRGLISEKLSLIDENSLKVRSLELSKNLAQLFDELNIIQDKICIGAFAPIAKEPRLDLLQSQKLAELTAYPAFDQKRALMFYQKARWDQLVMKADFGPKIMGPKAEAEAVIPALVLVPGLIFTEAGDRLGRGKGFYDKYLGRFQGIKVGLCFSEQIMDALPTEAHDVPLDYIVTEEKIIKCIRA